MNKAYNAILILSALILVLSVVTLVGLYMLSQKINPTMQVNPPPETTPYEPDSLVIEFYNDTLYQTMSPFQKYPTDGFTEAPVTTATPDIPATPDTDEAPDTTVGKTAPETPAA